MPRLDGNNGTATQIKDLGRCPRFNDDGLRSRAELNLANHFYEDLQENVDVPARLLG